MLLGVLPPDKIVVRDIDVFYVNGLAGADFHAELEGGATFAFFSFAPLSGDKLQSWRGRQVIEPGQTWTISTTGALDVSVSGYKLTGP